MRTNVSPILPVSSPARRLAITAAALAVGCLAVRSSPVAAEQGGDVSHSAESIHQEPSFKATRERIYQALMEPEQFGKVTELSGAMKSMARMKRPTEISQQAGGAFALFGGYIVGRHVELVPNERIVQAWRVGSWEPGVYSLVRFELTEQGAGTRIIFDHTGFPIGQGEHLAAGWQTNYWAPLEKFLA